MSIFDSIILGIIEGVTEFLPISSTAHLIMASSALGLEHTDFLTSFEVAIQLGAILSVVVLYWRAFLDMAVMRRLAAAFVPTAIIGLLAYPFAKAYLLGNEMLVVWTLALGGTALIVFEVLHREPEVEEGVEPPGMAQISYLQAIGIGLFQALAIVPGVSRSAATIVGGLLLGVRRVVILEFSFLLAVPTMLAATGLDLFKTAPLFSGRDIILLLVGFVVSFFVALLSITWLLSFVRRHTFISFGVYRIIIAGLFLLFLLS